MKPYYETELGKLYHGDCLEILPQLTEKVDIVITSPPYNLGNNHHTGSFRHTPYADDLPEEEYQKNQVLLMEKIYQTLTPNGSFFYNHKNRIKKGVCISPLSWILKTSFILKQEIVWVQRSQNFDKCRFYPFTESVFWLAKSINTSFYNKINKSNVWSINPVGTKQEHTRAYPLEIPNNILACFPEGLTFDPFLGSGTTAVACERLGRRWIGIEISLDYVKIAVDRIERERSQLKLNL